MAKDSFAASETVLDRVAATRETDIHELWQNLFAKISTFSSHQIQRFPKGQIDEQDITSSVFASLIRGCREGRFSEVSDYEECLRLLQTMAKRKIVDRVRYLTRKKRGGSGHEVESLEHLTAKEVVAKCDESLQPEAKAIVNEVIENSLRYLDSHLRPVVGLRLQGYEHQEIAEMLNISISTVSRKLHLVREMWKEQIQLDNSDLKSCRSHPCGSLHDS